FAELGDSQALFLARGVDTFCIGRQSGVIYGDGVPLLLAELRQLLLELALAPVEIRRPGHEPLLEPLLHRCDCLCELDARALGLAFDRVAPLLGEAPFLLAELVTGVRALAGEHPLELENSLLRLLLREG